jgi:hypothetical protein
MRERHTEFAAYFAWLERDFNCGPNPGPGTACTMVGIRPGPAEMRDPDKLGRYLDAMPR